MGNDLTKFMHPRIMAREDLSSYIIDLQQSSLASRSGSTCECDSPRPAGQMVIEMVPTCQSATGTWHYFVFFFARTYQPIGVGARLPEFTPTGGHTTPTSFFASNIDKIRRMPFDIRREYITKMGSVENHN